MSAYREGNWTNSTVETLKFISDENNAGRKPKLKDMKSGTRINWTWVFRQGGYVLNEDGYFLTEKGKQLLNSLLNNPPQDRRGKIKKQVTRHEKMSQEEAITKFINERKQDKIKKDYRITIAGRDLTVDTLITHDEAMRLIKTISEIKGKQKEKELFMKLLSDITSRIRQPAYVIGRPTNPLNDTIYSMVFKVYSTFSGRRFSTDMKIARENKFVEKKIPYNSMFDYFQKKELTPILADMVTLTSLPLTTIEHDFAIDSTGFGTNQFQRWFSFKHGKEVASRMWVKCHFLTGVKSNIVTSVKITSEFDNDCPQLQELVKQTAENFDMQEVSGDKAYLSRHNMNVIKQAGAIPFIPFKSNTTDRSDGSYMWKKMYHYFMLNNEEFMSHYHKRSNAESTVHMIKSKFGDFVRSKRWTSQINEVLCKIICHNIVVVIHEMHELGINPDFCPNSQEFARNVGV